MKRVSLLLVLCPWAAACAMSNMSDVLADRKAGSGTGVAYPLSKEQAWDVSRTVLLWCKANVIDEHKTEDHMLAECSNVWGHGGYAGVWLKPVSPTSTEVTVVTRRRDPLDAAPPITENYFHRRF